MRRILIRCSIAVVIALIFGGALEGAAPETGAAATAPSTQPAPATQPADYLDVAEAVFRYQFDHNASGAQRQANYFFLTLEGRDPPLALMKRFATEKPEVLPGSVARTSKERGVEHRYRGGSGVILRIGSITWIDDKTADVSGGYYEGSLSASGNTYHVEKKDGKWVVTDSKMHWIS